MFVGTRYVGIGDEISMQSLRYPVVVSVFVLYQSQSLHHRIMQLLSPQRTPLSVFKLGNLRLALFEILQLSIREKLALCEHLFQPSQKTLEAFPLLQVNKRAKDVSHT